MSSDISNKSKELLAKNLEQSQTFFTKLKAFIDFLNMPNYSKEEVRQKKVLADKITRVMFEEEQRLRRGMDLSELKNLDSILNVKNCRPTSAYAAMQNTACKDNVIREKVGLQPAGNSKFSNSSNSADSSLNKPILRRERTFDLEHSSILKKDLKCFKLVIAIAHLVQRMKIHWCIWIVIFVRLLKLSTPILLLMYDDINI